MYKISDVILKNYSNKMYKCKLQKHVAKMPIAFDLGMNLQNLQILVVGIKLRL